MSGDVIIYSLPPLSKQHRWRSRRSSRRLITLVFAGRNRMHIIRRELPLTEFADLVSAKLVSILETRCTKDTRVLLLMSPAIATSIARSINISMVDVAATTSSSHPVVVGFVFGVVIGFSPDANLPDEAEQLTTNCSDDLRLVLARAEQGAIARMQSMLSLPGDLFRFGSNVGLSLQQVTAQPRSELIGPGSLHQHASQVSVTGLGDAALITMSSTRVFPGNQPAVTHQLFGAAETGELNNFRGQSSGADLGDTAQCLQRLDDLAHTFGCCGNGISDRLIQSSYAQGHVLNFMNVIAECGFQRRQIEMDCALDPLHVMCGPGGLQGIRPSFAVT